MKISYAKKTAARADVVVVLAHAKAALSESAAAYDKLSKGAVKKAIAQAGFKGGAGKALSLYGVAGSGVPQLVVLGTGTAPEKMTDMEWQHVGAGLAAVLKGKAKATVVVDGDISDAPAHLAHGLRLKSYSFDLYKTKASDAAKAVSTVSVQCDHPTATRRAHKALDAVAQGVDVTRNLVTEPANTLTPKAFAARVKELEELGVKVRILSEKQMARLGMGALLGVGQGSANESQLAVMEWRGAPGKKGGPLALVGKGVTFDTGGISIKPAGGMEMMKFDMGGAAAITGAMHTLAARKAKANVVAVLGLVENMPGSNAQRPGDVVKTMDGQTVEVINTDAEGRLVLADALTYTLKTFKPSHVIDFATLTGAIIVTLGHEYAGLFSTNDELAGMLEDAGDSSGDVLWRLPMGPAYDRKINSNIADMKNVGGRDAGSITAAQFIARFAQKTPWAHVDIAGAVWDNAGRPLSPKGATGYGVALVDALVRENFE